MSKEFGVFSVNDAKEIKRRVLSGNRASLPSINSGEQLVNKYYGVLTSNLGNASNTLTNPSTAYVRIIKYIDVIARTTELATGDSALLLVVNRCKSVSYTRGTLVIVERIMNEWYISGSDCNSQSSLIAALDALE